MKIGICADNLLKCGGIRVGFEYAKELTLRGHSVAIYANKEELGINDWKERYKVAVRPISDLNEGVDVLISLWWCQFDELLKYPAKKRFHLNQGRDHLSYPDGSFKKQNLIEMQRTDFDFISVSKWSGVSCRDPRIVPNGVDTKFWCPAPFAKLSNKFRILFESSSPDKGKGRLKAIEILKAIKNEYPDKVELWEVTKVAQDQSIFDLQKTDPNDVGILNAYQNCDVLLKTSKFDGFGLSHLEAMSSGIALVTTNAGGNAEFCKDGENCFMSNIDIDLVNGIKRFLLDESERQRIIYKAHDTANQMTWSKSTDRLIEVIDCQTEC